MNERKCLGRTWGTNVYLDRSDEHINPRVVMDWNGNDQFEMSVEAFLDVAEWVEDEMDETELALR